MTFGPNLLGCYYSKEEKKEKLREIPLGRMFVGSYLL